MPDETISTAPVTTGSTPTEPKIDEPPKISPEIQAEIDRVAAEKARQLKREEFDDLTKKAEEKALYWRKEKARARDEYFRDRGRPPEFAPAEKPTETFQRPKQEDFETYQDYEDAVADHRVELKLAKWKEEESKKNADTQFQQKLSGLHQKLDEGYNLYSDFEEIAKDPTVPINVMIRDILTEIDEPARVAYYLGKNRAEAVKISQMTPFRAHKEILRIEAEIMKNPLNPQLTPKPPGASGAPPPIKPSGGSDVNVKDPAKMTQKEYEEWAKQKGMRRF